MNRLFLRLIIEIFNFKKFNGGFTLIELIISSSISTIVLISGYYLSNAIDQNNKNEKTQIELFSKIDGALDFIIDEINSGKRIISSKDNIPANCSVPEGDFILGISLPIQATDSSAYLNETSWTNIDCPVMYYLKNPSPGIKNTTHELWRFGPSINEDGFYQSSSFTESLIADKISNEPLKEIKCSVNWSKSNIKGISVCFDNLNRSAELSITATKRKFRDNYLYITKTSAGSNRIQDDLLMGITESEDESVCLNSDTCNMFGNNGGITGNVTFLIDTSVSMNTYLRAKKKTRMNAVKDELIKLIENFANINFQIIAFGEKGGDKELFEKIGPQPSTKKNKSLAIKWVSELSAYQNSTFPMQSLKDAIDTQTQQIVLLSDGEPTRYEGLRKNQRYCSHTNSYESIHSCVSSYNELISSEPGKSKVRIDTISIPDNLRCRRGVCFEKQYCESKLNPFNNRYTNNWMGKLSSDNGGKCTIIK